MRQGKKIQTADFCPPHEETITSLQSSTDGGREKNATRKTGLHVIMLSLSLYPISRCQENWKTSSLTPGIYALPDWEFTIIRSIIFLQPIVKSCADADNVPQAQSSAQLRLKSHEFDIPLSFAFVSSLYLPLFPERDPRSRRCICGTHSPSQHVIGIWYEIIDRRN